MKTDSIKTYVYDLDSQKFLRGGVLLVATIILFYRFQSAVFIPTLIILNFYTCLLKRKYFFSSWPFIVNLSLLGWFIANNFYSAANHYFTLFLILLGYVLESIIPENEKASYNINFQKYMLVGVMFFATLSKILSPSFMDGSFMAWMFFSKKFFPEVMEFFSPGIIKLNYKLFATAKAEIPHEVKRVQFILPFDKNVFYFLTLFLSWSTVAIEALLSFLFLKGNYKHIAHLLLVTFVFLLASTIPEYEFFTIVLLLGLSQVATHSKLRFLYFGALIIFFIILLGDAWTSLTNQVTTYVY